MKSVNIRDNLHEMSKLFSGKNKKNISICCELKFLWSMLDIKQNFLFFLFAVLHRCVPEALADLLDEVGTLEGNINKMQNKSNLVDRNNQTLNTDDLDTGLR